MLPQKIALLIEPSDHNFLPFIKPFLVGHKVAIIEKCPELVAEITTRFDSIICAREDFLKKLTFSAPGSSLENYAGSLLERNKKPIVVIDPLEQIQTTRTGEFLVERYLSKITRPEKWFKESKFTWEIANDSGINSIFELFSTADILATDIETVPYNVAINCVGYCGIWFTPDGGFKTHSIVLPFTSMFWVLWVRKFNNLPAPKIFQNGLFDNLYFWRWGCPVRNWAYDTQELFHSWYSELPKSLDCITAFSVRDSYYWKQEGKTGNIEDYYRYNAKDCWATANSWLAMLAEAPEWALRNYNEKFPLVFPCLTCAFDGFQINEEARQKMGAVQGAKLEQSLDSLRKKIGRPSFNPGSWQQLQTLIWALGYKEETRVPGWKNRTGAEKFTTDKKTLAKIAKKHPLPQLLIGAIRDYKDAKKLLSSYLEASLFHGRFLYSLAPSGTDTGRLASRKSSFFHLIDPAKSATENNVDNYGQQVQNIPPYVKEMVESDDGFYLGEIDNKNSEGFCVGYLSGDENLIATLNSGRDFHCLNAAKFFGIPYSELFNDETEQVLNKIIRDLSKRVNHGANYNMAETVLIETMGAENILRAKALLGLPAEWGLRAVAAYLLEKYARTYPDVKGPWYDFIKASVKLTSLLVSPLGWTRYCFGEPWKNKPDLNAYVAHAPQNLSVGIINRGFRRVFNEIQLPNWNDFRLKAQIHDSILFQYRVGRLDLVARANELMKQEVPVKDCKGVERIMRIPTDVKAEDRIWANLKKVNKELEQLK